MRTTRVRPPTAAVRMEHRRFGNADPEVSVVGQGTWYIESGDRASAVAPLRQGMDLGMTHIDTAELYGSGATEGVVAEAIGGRRDEVFLVSKVVPENASRRGTMLACEGSLARLKTDRLDSYLLHRPGRHPETSVGGLTLPPRSRAYVTLDDPSLRSG